MPLARTSVALACAALLGALPLRAQQPDSALVVARRPRHALLVAGVLAGSVAAAAPFDAAVARSMESASARGPSLNGAARTVGDVGGLGAPLIGLGLLAAGNLTGHDGLADAGWHATASFAVATAVTFGVKYAVGRARPSTAQWNDPGERAPDSDEFRPIHGRGAWASFPSGHTTAAFAVASSLSAELARHDPEAARLFGPMMYAGAGLVGLSRMVNNAHWASDVVAGAIIGTLVGRRVVARAHDGSRGFAGRLLPAGVAVTPSGSALAWSYPLP